MAWQAGPYRQAVLSKNQKATDLTAQLSRSGNALAGEGAAVQTVAAGLSYAPTGQEGKIRRLVIVDDTFTTGTTITAIVETLRKHGLPAECEIVVACPLWLDTVSRARQTREIN
jgi:glutamine phosphoribosylpyrophosphate amidotransferase